MIGAAAAQDPNTDPMKLMRLARSRNEALRELVARNPSTPSAALGALAGERGLGVIRAVAANPSAPPAALLRLVESRDASVRAAVYGNPSTPPEVLANILNVRGLTVEEKVAAAANPSTPDPTLTRLTWHDASEPIKLAVAGNRNASAKTLSDLFGGRSPESASRAFCEALATNPAAPTAVRARLFRVDAYRPLVAATEPAESTSTRIAHARSRYNDGGAILRLLAHDLEPEVRRAVALSPRATGEILDVIALDQVAEVALVARARRSADLDELHRLGRSNDQLVLEALARNANTPADVRASIARQITNTAGDDLLEELARDSSTPNDVLMTLATNPNRGVRQAVASSPTTPIEVIVRLTIDPDSTIRSQVARAGGLPTRDLVRLASDDDPSVRAAVASNNSTPTELLLRLAPDEAPGVAEAVASNGMSTPAVMARVVSAQVDRWQARSPKPSYVQSREQFPMGPLAAAAASERTPAESLRSIAVALSSNLSEQLTYSRNESRRRETASVWIRLAGNPNVPADTLDSIAQRALKDHWSRDRPNSALQDLESFREAVLRSIVLNPSTSAETLEHLADARWVARKTHRVSDRELSSGYSIEWDEYATGSAIKDTAHLIRTKLVARRWKDNVDHSERLRFAMEPDAPEDVLAVLAEDSHTDVRRGVAANPSTSPASFMRLVTDSADVVRIAAAHAVHPDPASRAHEPYGSRRKRRESAYRDAFEVLAQDEVEDVRLAVAENTAVFWDTLSKRARSRMVLRGSTGLRAVIVGSIAGKTGRTLSRKALRALIDEGDEETWRTLAQSYYQLPLEIMERLVDTGDSATAVAVVNDYYASDELLVRLAGGGDEPTLVTLASRRHFGYGREKTHELVAQALLRNPKTPESVVAQLATGALDDAKLELIARHPNLPEATLVSHAQGIDNRWLRVAAMSGNSRAVAAVASNNNAPAELLELISSRGDAAVRQALILNENTPQDLLVALIERDASSE